MVCVPVFRLADKMNIPTDIVCVLLTAIIGLQGFMLLTLQGISNRTTRIETALELQGLLEPRKKR